MRYADPGQPGSKLTFKTRYDNFIGGEWVPPVEGQYFDNTTPVTGKVFCQVARSQAADIELALDAAHKAREGWARTAPAQRAALLFRIADRLEANLELLAVAETWENGKPVRETLAADIPLAIDHFRYFASCIRAQEGALSEIDETTVAYHFHEPLGVVGQIIPWNFPILMAAWKIAPALAAGNCIVMKPAEQTPVSLLVLIELIQDLLPPGILNIVNGFGIEAGKPLATNKRIAKIAFTGETTTGRLIMQYASQNIIPSTVELGGKSPNVFFDDVMDADDDYFDKCLEGFAMFSLNQGEVCTCPSRALVQENIADKFIERAIARVNKVRGGHPLDTDTMIGAQASSEILRGRVFSVEREPIPGATITVTTTADGQPAIEGRVTLGRLYEGPPNGVHGGYVAGLFDDILGGALQLARVLQDDDAFVQSGDLRQQRVGKRCLA